MKSIFKKKEKTPEELMNDELIALMRKEIETLSDDEKDDAAKSAATLRLHRFAEDLEKFKAEKLEKSKRKHELLNSICPALITAGATLTATFIFVFIEHRDCISGVAGKEIVRVVLGGLFNRRR